jgi:hypothetical protein
MNGLTVSGLVEVLQEFKLKHGDLPVIFYWEGQLIPVQTDDVALEWYNKSPVCELNAENY